MAKHNISKIEKKINILMDNISGMNLEDDLKELLRIVRLPGWTTPAEFQFLFAALEAMEGLVQSLEGLSAGVLSASKLVGTDGE